MCANTRVNYSHFFLKLKKIVCVFFFNLVFCTFHFAKKLNRKLYIELFIRNVNIRKQYGSSPIKYAYKLSYYYKQTNYLVLVLTK